MKNLILGLLGALSGSKENISQKSQVSWSHFHYCNYPEKEPHFGPILSNFVPKIPARTFLPKNAGLSLFKLNDTLIHVKTQENFVDWFRRKTWDKQANWQADDFP